MKFLLKISQIIIALTVFFVFSLYIWVFQLTLEHTNNGLIKASLFAVIIFSGGVSYDIAKHLIFLDGQRFSKFMREIKKLSAHLALFGTLIVISAILLSRETFAPKYFGAWFYLFSLIDIYWLILHAAQAIKEATETEKS
jgi:hypothetical protein